MSPPPIHWVEDLSHNDTLAFTKLLRLPERSQIDEYWLASQEKKIKYLPAHLKRSKALLPRFVEKFLTTKAILCPSHRGLDQQLIRRLFVTIVDECTTRVRRFTDSPPSDSDIRQWWIRVKSINSLWTQPILYRYLFNANPGDPEFEYTHSECEACILATIGGNSTMLSDLRICAITRRRNNSSVPRIIRILDGWLYWTGMSEAIKAGSDVLCLKVRNARRGRPISQQRSDRNTIPETVNDNRRSQRIPESTDADIIDFYLNRLSRMTRTHQTSGRPNNDSTPSLHPAFRENIVFNASTGGYGQRQENDIPPVPRIPSIIPEPIRQRPVASSRYSNDYSGASSSNNTSKRTEWRHSDYAQQRSEAYRKLVGDPEYSEVDNIETRPLINSGRRSPERARSPDTARRWSGSNNARGYDRAARHRAKAFRKLEGKAGGSSVASSTLPSPKLTWEQFSTTVHLSSGRNNRD
ncbi:hypothetical protein V495_04375 [Pseudogymnoascus sp. VKM F-4514 (FW-929)]|nr:hypothetical protein V490_08490 [Pseudogymnoascus sp. VKM F-3557]KFY42697.1 hypothetical protein V495_04375 [Pseudogymnoascus sp. VKM F-4514 (FW-929)]KFY54012.1 hypothetical protein V497_08049 [Pseudogymnoascus sp. VKM F-4516 (FW-969)]